VREMAGREVSPFTARQLEVSIGDDDRTHVRSNGARSRPAEGSTERGRRPGR
jgi:hypothetical protein